MLKVGPNGRCFVDGAGRPTLWLADTAWNGALRATDEQWRQYLHTRKGQGFNVVQLVTTQWRGCTNPPGGKPLKFVGDDVTIDEDAKAVIDARVAAVRAAGLTPAPVMFWAIGESDPGQRLTETQLIEIGRRMLDRWSGHEPVWLLAGDGRYEGEVAERWKRVGRAIFEDRPDAVVTMHPCGLSWVGDTFADEPWYSFVGIQSGHGKRENDLRFLLRGDWAGQWRHIVKPFVNIEPNYEGHPAYGTGEPFDACDVRRATWWSLLTAPMAGITYGNNEIWNWRQDRGPAENHPNLPDIRPWHEGLETEGIANLTTMRAILDRFAWWTLTPAPELLAEQPGDRDLNAFIAVASNPDRTLTLAYLPRGGAIRFAAAPAGEARWIDPRTGTEQPAPELTAPSHDDWLLRIDG